ncbi:MAG: hypothetical protein ACI4GY_03205 [Acutalibacteraceae bacterium]
MTQTVIVALISLLGSLFGTLGGILTSSKLTNYRLEQLEKKVAEHNNLVSRTYELEANEKMLEEKINTLSEKIGSMNFCPAKTNKERNKYEI